MAHVCIDIDLSILFDVLIQINNLCVFFKYRLLLWSLFDMQMYTHMYKFKPFPILFYLQQLAAVVFGKQECRGMYI